MANIIYADTYDQVAGALFSPPSRPITELIGNKVKQYANSISHIQPDMAKNLMDKFRYYTSNQYRNNIESMQMRLRDGWEVNEFKPLNSIDDIRYAPPIMQPFIISNPYLSEHLHKGLIEAYDGNMSHMSKADTDYFYRRTMDGVVSVTDKGLEYTNYYEKLRNESDHISIMKKSIILKAWRDVEEMVENGDMRDPTSLWNSTVG